jgi:hypothetical protein
VLKARLAARRTRPSVSDATDVELDELISRQEPLDLHEAAARVRIDTSGDRATAADAAVRALDAAGIHPARARRAS